jgi:hypothetical protein
LEGLLAKRLIRWVFFNCLFAIFPFLYSLYVTDRADKSVYQAWSNSPELLFFALITTATVLGDLFEKWPIRWNIFFTVCGLILLMFVILFACQYGNFQHSLVTQPEAIMYRDRLLRDAWYAVWIAAGFSTIVEMLLGWVDESASEEN